MRGPASENKMSDKKINPGRERMITGTCPNGLDMSPDQNHPGQGFAYSAL